MKRKSFQIYILVGLVLLAAGNTKIYSNTNQYIIKAIQNKVVKYIKQTYNLDSSEIVYQIPSFYMPQYKLYDIGVDKADKDENSVNLIIKVSNFFNKNEYITIPIRIKIKEPTNNITVNKNLKLIYRRGQVSIKTYGRVLQKNNDVVIVQTEFGKKLKCRIINQETAEVIK